MKKYYEILKDNFSLIVAIPPLFGAIWQLIELSKISLSYIRFFSISQLVADGVLFLITILIFFASSIWIKIITDSVKNEKVINDEVENQTKHFEKLIEVEKPNLLYSFFFSIIGLGIMTIGIFFANDYFLKNLNSLGVIWCIIPSNIFIVAFGYTLYLKGINYVDSIFSENRNKRLKTYGGFIICVFYKKLLFTI